ncbi:MAG TPA: HEAT repeat domain-containing protein [Pyrinomonadaceae bacterium]|jgi:hypothetical protein
MTGGNSNHHPKPDAPAGSPGARRRSPWPLAVIAALFIIVPFLTWYGTWFGRSLKDETVEEYLRDEKPRHVQHALAEIEKRIAAGDAQAKRWYPQIVALARHASPDVRLTVAWVMGVDTRAEEFHPELLRLLEDGEPIVRRNAALSLVSFGDAGSLKELRAMLKPYTVVSAFDGTAQTVLSEGSKVNREAMLARVRSKEGESLEVRAPLDGKIEKTLVREGDELRAGQEIFVLAPDVRSVEDALVGLRRFGEQEDLPEVERYARGVEGMPSRTKELAAQTAEAIKRRATQKQTHAN